MTTDPSTPVVMSIAGSDSGGGAGIQADLKTFEALGCFGTTALTCVTAQNPDGVTAIHAIPGDVLREQIRMICTGFPVAAAKTGMLYSAELIRIVAEADLRDGIPVLVVDPVMVASSGARLLREDAIAALCTELLPHARVVTPNLHEAEILWGHAISSADELREAARAIGEQYDIACVAKGAHLPGDEVVDVLFDEGEEMLFRAPRVVIAHTHGCGCTFSAALAAFLAQGRLLHDAVAEAKSFVGACLAGARPAGRHAPLHFRGGVRGDGVAG